MVHRRDVEVETIAPGTTNEAPGDERTRKT